MTVTPPTPDHAPDELDPALAAVRRWRRELVEVGGPNTLLWRPADDPGRLELTHAHPAGLAIFLSGRDVRLSDLVREPHALQHAVEIARGIRAAVEHLWEERGLATCFLAAGMVSWRMPGGYSPSAPVFLRPCELRPRDAGEHDFDVVVSPTVEVNPALVELLRAEHGIELDAARLVETSWGRNGFDPEHAYRSLSAQCGTLPGLSVERRLGVGIYPYAKLAMVADLEETVVARHPLVRAMAGLPTTLREPTPAPRAMPLVLPADATQRAALAAIGAGDDIVVQGAPGTGTTQVVANAVAGLAAAGRSILLVSHKRAAIDAVRRRLAEVGLDLVTEAHDGPDLRHEHGPIVTVTVPRAVEPQRETAQALHDAADLLQGRLAALHEVREPWGISAFQAQGALVELASLEPAPSSRVRLTGEALRRLVPQQVSVATQQMIDVARDGAWTTHDEQDPWRGARVLTTADAARTLAACQRLLSTEGIDRLLRQARRLQDETGLRHVDTLEAIDDDLQLMMGVRTTLDTLVPEVWEAPLTDMLEATSSSYRSQHGSTLGMVRRGSLKRDARRLLHPGPGPSNLHDALAAAHSQLTRWHERAADPSHPTEPTIPAGLDDVVSAYFAVADDVAALQPVLATTTGGDLAGRTLPEIRSRLAELLARHDRLSVLPQVTSTLDELRALGLGDLVDDLARRRIPADRVAAEVRHVWWTSVLDEIRRTDQRYGKDDGASAHAVADELRRLEARALRERAGVVSRATHDASPCLAVSPYEVGALLPPGQVVDTVIVLEASQLSVAQAVSAVSRGRQVVVCGDHQQLPPAELSFAVGREDDDVLADQRAFSVLSVLAARLPVHTLGTHHRTVDDRLAVTFDDELYIDEPVVVPAAATTRTVSLELVELSTRTRNNLREAPVTTPDEVERVVRLALAQARSAPGRSLGIITLHPAHTAAIRARMLEELSSVDPHDLVGSYFGSERPEPFFVKTVDDVQGDTRDDVILSIGYALDDAGRAAHRYGRLALAMGERRVALAATRARRTLTIVSTLTSEQIDHTGGGAAGVDLLAQVVRLAEDPRTYPPSQGQLPDPVMTDLVRRLRREGLEVTERAGRGVGPIELAVRDPRILGGGMVAVESDGPLYAAMPRPLDRDLLRPALVEAAGWTHLRVWTQDLFVAPEREVARIVEATQRRVHRPTR